MGGVEEKLAGGGPVRGAGAAQEVRGCEGRGDFHADHVYGLI